MFKNRTFVALAALILVGGATLWKVTRPDPHAAGQTPSAGAAVYHVAKADVDELEITEPKKPPINLKKDGAAWKITAPVADRADQKAVDQALDALAALKLKDVIAEKPESYEQVGVKDDDVVKVVPKQGGKPLATLLLGKATNVRIEGDPRVFATADLKRYALVKEPRMWRDRMVLEIPAADLDKVALEYPGGAKIVLGHEAQGTPPPPPEKDKPAPPKLPDKWIVVEGKDKIGGTAVDETLAATVASGLARIEADDFADGADPSTTGLGAPRTTVTTTTKDSTQKTFLIGKDDGQSTYVQLKDGPRIWKVHKYDADKIPTSPAQWRAKVIVQIDAATVTKLQIEKDKDKTVLERVDDKTFKATTPADLGELDQTRVQTFLKGLQSLKAGKVLENTDAKAAGLDKPRVVVTLWKKDGSNVKITIAPTQNGDAPISVSNLPDLYALSDYQVGTYVKGPKDFAKKAAAPPPQAAAMPGHR